ncbi:hypothetical protein [Demequina sp.]|uniref:hypothetical protein n=1 Tax=Demequina sp. TaxID=2050685 RepID=UPI003D0DE9FA
MRSADFTRTAATLPALYQDDAASFAQVDAFLGLADELAEAIVAHVDSLAFTLGPDAGASWPHDVPLGAGGAELIASLTERYDALAEWFAFDVPSSWGAGEVGLSARRRFLTKAARLWRRRGTPRGFVDWFCTYFAIDAAADRPFLLEHFKVPGGALNPGPFTATLFVPNSATFVDYRRRVEAAEFVDWYAPAHVAMRICYVAPGFLEGLPAPATLAPTEADVTTFRNQLLAQLTTLRELACTVVSVIDHANGIHLYGCDPATIPPTALGEPRSVDHLSVGHLPTELT